MTEDDRIFRAAKTDFAPDALSPELRLMWLLARATGEDGLTSDEWEDLYDQAVASAGSVGAAIEALESGRMSLEKHQEDQ